MLVEYQHHDANFYHTILSVKITSTQPPHTKSHFHKPIFTRMRNQFKKFCWIYRQTYNNILEQHIQRRLFLTCGTNEKYKWFQSSKRQSFFMYLQSLTSLWQIILLPLMFPHYSAVGIWWALHWKLFEAFVTSPLSMLVT